MRLYYMTLISTHTTDVPTAIHLCDAADDLYDYLHSIAPDSCPYEALQEVVDNYILYYVRIAIYYRTLFIIDKNEIRTNILINHLVDGLGFDFEKIDVTMLLAISIRAQQTTLCYTKSRYLR